MELQIDRMKSQDEAIKSLKEEISGHNKPNQCHKGAN